MPAGHVLDVLSSASEHRERGLGDLHVLRVVASTDANAADNLVAEFERISTTKNDEPIDSCWRAGSQGRIVLDELVPGVGGHAKSGRCIRFVLRDLHAQQRRTVHPAERLQDAALIDNCDGERMAHLRRVSLRRFDQSMRQFSAYALFAEGVCHLCLSSNWLAAKTLLQGLNLRKSNKIKELAETRQSTQCCRWSPVGAYRLEQVAYGPRRSQHRANWEDDDAEPEFA